MKKQISNFGVRMADFAKSKVLTKSNIQTAMVLSVALLPAIALAAAAEAPDFVGEGVAESYEAFVNRFEDMYAAAEGTITGMPGKAFTGMAAAVALGAGFLGKPTAMFGALGLGLMCQIIPMGLNFLFSATF